MEEVIFKDKLSALVEDITIKDTKKAYDAIIALIEKDDTISLEDATEDDLLIKVLSEVRDITYEEVRDACGLEEKKVKDNKTYKQGEDVLETIMLGNKTEDTRVTALVSSKSSLRIKHSNLVDLLDSIKNRSSDEITGSTTHGLFSELKDCFSVESDDEFIDNFNIITAFYASDEFTNVKVNKDIGGIQWDDDQEKIEACINLNVMLLSLSKVETRKDKLGDFSTDAIYNNMSFFDDVHITRFLNYFGFED